VLISLSAGVFLLWLIGRGQDIHQILREFREANYLWILMAAAATLLSHVLRAKRWNLLIGSMDYPVKTGQTFYALMTGYLSNLAVPRLGELTRCLVLSRSGTPPLNTLIGTVLIERVFDMLCLGLIIFLTIAFQLGFLREFLDRMVINPLLGQGSANMLGLGLIFVVGLLLMVWALLALRSKLKDPPENGFFFKLKRQVHGVKNGVKTIARMEKKVQFLLYSAGIWMLYFLMVYLCFFALSSTAHLGVSTGITLLAVGSLGIVAPVPGGIGTYHFLTITALTELYGIAPEPAISYAYISHATQMVVIIAAGTISWVLISLEQKKRGPGMTKPSPEQVHRQ
jgi:glycosyltransferase 2 family protein